MEGFSKEIKGLTKTDLTAIMRGFIRDSQVDQLFEEFGLVGWYGKRKIHFIPFESLPAVREKLVKMNISKWWDVDREKLLTDKLRQYKVSDMDTKI